MKKTVCEIINPSDHCTMEADDPAVACVAVSLLSMMYGLRSVDPPEAGEDPFEVPPLAFVKDAEEWFVRRYGFPVHDVTRFRKAAVLDCLDSVVLGDRVLFLSALEKIESAEAREKFIEEWDDRCRSSLNDIKARAKALVASNRKNAGEEVGAPCR